MLKWVGRIVGGALIVVLSFFGTLYAMDYLDARSRDAIRADHARVLKSALESYRQAKGTYPVTASEIPVDDLQKLISEYLKSKPEDPLWSKQPNRYRYISSGPIYGILFHIELSSGGIPAGGQCIIRAGAPTGWWGSPPECPF